MCGHFSAIMAMVGPPTYPAPMQHTVLFEREREEAARCYSREKQISETRSRVEEYMCVFDHDDARFVSSGTKRTTPTTKRVLQKIIETTRERRSKTGDDRSIDRSILRTLGYLHHLFCFDDDAKGTTNAQSTLEYLGYYYVKRKEKRKKEAVMNEGGL